MSRRARKDYSRESSLLRKYGITLAQYDELFERQKGRCWICNRHRNEFKHNLSVDHNHKTGEIRGLLCFNCNAHIVGRNNNPEIARKLYEYLSQGTGWFVPSRTKLRRKR